MNRPNGKYDQPTIAEVQIEELPSDLGDLAGDAETLSAPYEPGKDR